MAEAMAPTTAAALGVRTRALALDLGSDTDAVVIDVDLDSDSDSDSNMSPSSLFDEPTSRLPSPQHTSSPPATLLSPPIPGLFFSPTLLLLPSLTSSILTLCISTFFSSGTSNQAMLFGTSRIPPFLHTLLSAASDLLRPAMDPETHSVLFDPREGGYERQAIVNLYRPGEGIKPHVDLPSRYADGVVGISLGSGCAMRFAPVRDAGEDGEGEGDEDARELWLPERSVVAMSGPARYDWTHGIVARETDVVERVGAGVGASVCGGVGNVEVVPRGTRVSVTFRWLLPGADVVGA